MSDRRDVRSHFEAGIALLYGEIGELLDRVEALRVEIPKVVDASSRELNTSVIAIVKATRGAQSAVAAYADAQEQRLVQVAERERAAIREQAQAVHAGPAQRTEVGPVAEEVSVTRATRRWAYLSAVAIVVGLVAAAGSYLGTTLALERQNHVGVSQQAAR